MDAHKNARLTPHRRGLVVLALNLHILDAFKRHGIEFAYPTAVEYQRELPARAAG